MLTVVPYMKLEALWTELNNMMHIMTDSYH